MNPSLANIPSYVKFSIIFMGISAFGFFLYAAQGVLIPLSFALLFATLLDPIVDLLRRIKIPRTVAISVATLAGFLFVMGVAYFILVEIAAFQESVPKFQQKLDVTIAEIKQWVVTKFHVNTATINVYSDKLTKNFYSEMGTVVGSAVMTAISLFFVWLLIPVYVFLFLYYQPLIFAVIQRAADGKNLSKIGETIVEINKMVQSYLRGLVLEAVLMAILNSVALLLLGIDYAILLGVIGAIINVIPYIGGVVSIALPMLVAFVGQNSLAGPALVFAALAFIQFIDNHFIVPFIVASRVKVNSLISIIAILSFGEMFGVAGMFVAIIYIAILKIVFDKIDALNPYGMLLGTYMPTTSRFYKMLESFKKK